MTDRMKGLLEMAENVTFRVGTPVKQITVERESKKIQITTDKPEPPISYDQVISTLFSKTLSNLCLSPSGTTLLPSLAETHAVTVSVVNLYYSNPSLLPISGFGYLIPQATPYAQNPELALGVVFDSEITKDQDTAPGTKLTVMLGGHWWDGWSSIPDEEQCVEMAKAVLKRHLGIEEEPVATHISTQKDCIPQYTVGHTQRLKDAHHALLRNFGGRLKVAGNSYTGVGVNDCLMAAQMVASAVLAPQWSSITGLEGSDGDMKFVSLGPGYAVKLPGEKIPGEKN